MRIGKVKHNMQERKAVTYRLELKLINQNHSRQITGI